MHFVTKGYGEIWAIDVFRGCIEEEVPNLYSAQLSHLLVLVDLERYGTRLRVYRAIPAPHILRDPHSLHVIKVHYINLPGYSVQCVIRVPGYSVQCVPETNNRTNSCHLTERHCAACCPSSTHVPSPHGTRKGFFLVLCNGGYKLPSKFEWVLGYTVLLSVFEE